MKSNKKTIEKLIQKFNIFLMNAPNFYINRYRYDREAASRGRTVFWFVIFFTTTYAYFFILAISWKSIVSITLFSIFAPFFLSFYWVMYRYSSFTTGIYICYTSQAVLCCLSIIQGGLFSAPLVWTFSIIPVASYTLADRRIAVQMTGLSLILILVFYIIDLFDILPSNDVPESFRSFYYMNAYVACSLLIYIFMNLIESDRNRAKGFVEEAHKEVLQLKVQQDGDYYLTSLILKPLQTNKNIFNNIKIESLISQKKKFIFKNWNSEIGGDICITDNIKLMGQNYVFFLNSDAMGKSLQGAGGSIVMGAVIKSILTRKEVNLYPEIWLQEMFFQLQSVFESFDGSMLISACFGLIHVNNYMLYLVNAEHPQTVLYRDNVSSFLFSDNHISYKFGVPENQRRFKIARTRLQPDDIIFCGSDGRDDLRMEDLQINEDETLFVRIVKEAGGDTNKVVSLLTKYGNLTDDLSLLRVQLMPVQSYHNDPLEKKELKKELINTLKDKNYVKAKNLCEKLLGYGYEDLDTLFHLAQIYQKLKQYREGLQLCNRIYILKPSLEVNLNLRKKFENAVSRQSKISAK